MDVIFISDEIVLRNIMNLVNTGKWNTCHHTMDRVSQEIHPASKLSKRKPDLKRKYNHMKIHPL